MTLHRLIKDPEGVDLGPLRQSCPEKIHTKDQCIDLAPQCLVDDVKRLMDKVHEYHRDDQLKDDSTFLLIGRRNLRSNNSWLHNTNRLKGGSNRCSLIMNSQDAKALNIKDKSSVKVQSRVGEVTVEVQLSEDIVAGVVSLPHGWGHHGQSVQMEVAKREPGQNVNRLTDEYFMDTLTGNAGFNGLSVKIMPVRESA